MRGVTIRDRDPANNTLSFDLRDILDLLGPDAARSEWRVRDVECVGRQAAEALHRSSDDGEVVGGTQLIQLARDVGQIIDGEFSARLPGMAPTGSRSAPSTAPRSTL